MQVLYGILYLLNSNLTFDGVFFTLMFDGRGVGELILSTLL